MRINIADVLDMIANGETYQEIGNKYGCSRQYIQQVLKAEGISRPRKNAKTYEQCPYIGLREWILSCEEMSITTLAKIAYGATSRTYYARAERMLKGSNVRLKVSQIKRLEDASGMSFRYLFERGGDSA